MVLKNLVKMCVFTLGHYKWHQIFISNQVVFFRFRLWLTLPVLFGWPHHDSGGHDDRSDRGTPIIYYSILLAAWWTRARQGRQALKSGPTMCDRLASVSLASCHQWVSFGRRNPLCWPVWWCRGNLSRPLWTRADNLVGGNWTGSADWARAVNSVVAKTSLVRRRAEDDKLKEEEVQQACLAIAILLRARNRK